MQFFHKYYLFLPPFFLFRVPSNFAYTAEKRHEPSDSNGGSRITIFHMCLGWRVLSSPLPFF